MGFVSSEFFNVHYEFDLLSSSMSWIFYLLTNQSYSFVFQVIIQRTKTGIVSSLSTEPKAYVKILA